MMDYDDLVGRLRHYTKTEPYYKHTFTQSADAIETLRRERDEAQNDATDLLSTFDLRWKADQRAIERWQAAHPGNDLTWPDGADLVVWLLDEHDAALALLREAGEVLEPFADACKHTIDCDADKWRDTDDLWESPVAMALCAGDLRRARAVLAKIKGEGECTA